ncbi:hypothetical protein I4U23_029384 [Adineta vaga]|nr:hypothetical protein I4U23_029384 [Adineta vaga]
MAYYMFFFVFTMIVLLIDARTIYRTRPEIQDYDNIFEYVPLNDDIPYDYDMERDNEEILSLIMEPSSELIFSRDQQQQRFQDTNVDTKFFNRETIPWNTYYQSEYLIENDGLM